MLPNSNRISKVDRLPNTGETLLCMPDHSMIYFLHLFLFRFFSFFNASLKLTYHALHKSHTDGAWIWMCVGVCVVCFVFFTTISPYGKIRWKRWRTIFSSVFYTEKYFIKWSIHVYHTMSWICLETRQGKFAVYPKICFSRKSVSANLRNLIGIHQSRILLHRNLFRVIFVLGLFFLLWKFLSYKKVCGNI